MISCVQEQDVGVLVLISVYPVSSSVGAERV